MHINQHQDHMLEYGNTNKLEKELIKQLSAEINCGCGCCGDCDACTVMYVLFVVYVLRECEGARVTAMLVWGPVKVWLR